MLSTIPEAGKAVEQGSTVEFTLSNGKVEMVDVIGVSLDAAVGLLTADDRQLNVTPVQDTSCPTEAGSPITHQSLPPGEVSQGSEVELTYCAG